MPHASCPLWPWLIVDRSAKSFAMRKQPKCTVSWRHRLGVLDSCSCLPQKGRHSRGTLQMIFSIRLPGRRLWSPPRPEDPRRRGKFSRKWETFSALCASKKIALDGRLGSLPPARESALLIPERTPKLAWTRSHDDDEPVPTSSQLRIAIHL